MSSTYPVLTVILDSSEYSEETLNLLRRLGPIHMGKPSDLQSAHATAVFVELGMLVDAPFLDRFPNLRFIVTPTTGVTHVDVEAAAARGVEVIALRRDAPELSDVSATAELTWGLLLALTRRIPQAGRAVARGGLWQRRPYKGVELRGRTLGVVGLGRLGGHVARYALAFGMNVLANDTNPSVFQGFEGQVEPASADELLAESDVVSIHLPYLLGQGPWLDAARIERMRRGAILLNTSRGELIDEVAVAAALRRGHLGGVGLDVLIGDSTWPDRVPPGHELVALAAEGAPVLITPHVGGFAFPALHETRQLVSRYYLERALRD